MKFLRGEDGPQNLLKRTLISVRLCQVLVKNLVQPLVLIPLMYLLRKFSFFTFGSVEKVAYV